MNMAIDEAVLRARIGDAVPNTLRLYRWKPSAVSLGKFQSLEREVYLENCRKYDVDIIRRITGGGAVYHDSEGEITYSIVARKLDLETPDITGVYAKIYAGLSEALRILGIAAAFNKGDQRVCPNLTVNGRKISGSAQCHKSGVVLQHGTLLVRINLEKMFTFLRVHSTRSCVESVHVARHRITSLVSELEREVSLDEVASALIRGFHTTFDVELVDGKLTDEERGSAEQFASKKYRTDDWNFRGTSHVVERDRAF
jgi:lipoate-protein ligase A